VEILSLSTSSASSLSKLDVFRMTNTEVPGESIVSTEGFLLCTQMTADFLLPRIVNCIFVSCEIVRPRENGVAGFASGGVNSFAFVRSVLRVPKRR